MDVRVVLVQIQIESRFACPPCGAIPRYCTKLLRYARCKSVNPMLSLAA
ncbi:MAG: hypothetical protein RL385_681 [Pseudomonadota bacterium]|jgi:hypothetical protein